MIIQQRDEDARTLNRTSLFVWCAAAFITAAALAVVVVVDRALDESFTNVVLAYFEGVTAGRRQVVAPPVLPS